MIHPWSDLCGWQRGGQRAHTPPTAQSWKDLRGGFLLLVGASSRG